VVRRSELLFNEKWAANPSDLIIFECEAGDIVVRRSELLFNEKWAANPSDLIIFECEAGDIVLQNQGQEQAELLLLSGVPIDEPIAAYGPFVMNTPDEIRESIEAYRRGEYGSLD
ncbi:pirin-like C-terminal cupin domain-containing protein, partial [Shewanella sp. Isolate7]|uniref:pirin-like C-terminal cupin domain-containing protein n=1 Tax=Shewanella sp. Isolate7 TaxID=2908528 RepID=UPI0023D8B88D